MLLQTAAAEAVNSMRESLPGPIRITEDFDPQCRAVSASSSEIRDMLAGLLLHACQTLGGQDGTLGLTLCEVDLQPGNSQGLLPGFYAKLAVASTGGGQGLVRHPHLIPSDLAIWWESAHGSDLGLTRVLGIVSGLDGKITVDSKVGDGSLFTVYLPLADQSRRAPSAPANHWQCFAGRIKGHILVVDDMDFNVRLGVQLLERLGCQATGQTDSEAALALFRAHPEQFSMVITDQTMPGLSGFEMAQAMREVRPDLPIIMVTGHSESVNEQEAKALGIRAILAKPLMIEQLVSAIEAIQQEGAVAQSALARPQGGQPQAALEERAQLPAADVETVREHLRVAYELSPEAILAMIDQLLQTLHEEMPKAHRAAAERDLSALVRAAHTLKGVLLNAGLNDWAELARGLEKKARQEELSGCLTLLSELAAGLAPLLAWE